MEQNRLLEFREEIDKIDRQIIDLYEKRVSICSDIAEYKIETGKKVFDRQREEEKLRRVREIAANEHNRQSVVELFEQIMCMSRKHQYRMMTERGITGRLPFIPMDELDTKNARIVYQGAEGAYSHLAALTFFGKDADVFHVDTFRDAMSAIDEGLADYSVLPIENSTAGVVAEIYDLLSEFENYIVGEQVIKVEHCLLGVKESTEDSIKKVYSHPQSLMQSSKFINIMGYEQVSMLNNAFAAKKVSEDGDVTQGAIASELAGQIYGLSVLKKGVNHESGNSTRFIIVTNQKIFRKDAGKISVYFELPHTSGSLYHMLSHFIFNNLNMTRIESRPVEDRVWEYRFFVDFEGNLEDEAVKNAISGLRDEARNLRVLGNY